MFITNNVITNKTIKSIEPWLETHVLLQMQKPK